MKNRKATDSQSSLRSCRDAGRDSWYCAKAIRKGIRDQKSERSWVRQLQHWVHHTRESISTCQYHAVTMSKRMVWCWGSVWLWHRVGLKQVPEKNQELSLTLTRLSSIINHKHDDDYYHYQYYWQPHIATSIFKIYFKVLENLRPQIPSALLQFCWKFPHQNVLNNT